MNRIKGFTLIELIVVIVILGILSAIAAPKFMDLQKDARVAYLNGIKGAIGSANETLHAYAVIHGLDNLDLNATSGQAYQQAMVRFDGNNIVKTTSDNDAQGVFFLNFGYVAVTWGSTRNSGLVQIIGRNANGSGTGNDISVRNYSGTASNIVKTKCEAASQAQDLCYMAVQESGKQWKEAYVTLVGFKPSECSVHYVAAQKDSDGVIEMPKITVISSGC